MAGSADGNAGAGADGRGAGAAGGGEASEGAGADARGAGAAGAGWRGPGFVDAHAHLLRVAARAPANYRLDDPASIASWHREVSSHGSTPMDEQRDAPARAEDLLGGLRRAAGLGLVEIWEAGVDVDAYLPALQQLREQGDLPVRVRLLMASGFADPKRPRLGDPWLEIEGVKFYADGWLGPRTCAMHAPFADAGGAGREPASPEDAGVLFLDADTLARRAAPFVEAGWVVATHAIGDRAITAVLDGYERVLAGTRAAPGRLRIEHAQCLRPEHLERMAESGVTACIQPSFATSDQGAARVALSDEQRATAYRWDLLLDAGIAVVAGSDYPIETLSPLRGLQRLVEGTAETPGLAVERAMAMMTSPAAGTTILSADPGAVASGDIATLEILGVQPHSARLSTNLPNRQSHGLG